VPLLVEIRLTEDDVERIAARLAEFVVDAPAPANAGWVDVEGAASYLSMSPDAVRGLVKRRQIPLHRTENGRLRFSLTELDEWVRSETCEDRHADLP
jgi:excisionase family DNA binding protein